MKIIPYKTPDGWEGVQIIKQHIVSFSGGAASFAVAVEVVKKYGKENVTLVFCDTTIEHEDLYRFIDEAAEKLEVPLIKLKDGRNPWQVFADERYVGNTRTAHCTIELKGKMFAKWLRPRYQPEQCVIHFGFDWSEADRLDKAKRNWWPYDCEAILCKPPYLSRKQIMQYLDDFDIETPTLYELGFTHNNCGGFCVRAGQGHFSRLLDKLPDVYKHHEEEQEKITKLIPTVRPFLRMVVNKKMNYLTLKQFREYKENGGLITSESGGCNCFTDSDVNGIDELLAK